MTQSLRVAVADDEPIMQMYLEETVSDLGYEVVAAASDGEQLIEECRSKNPDLVITDIMMPHVDGIPAVRELCRDAPVPVVFITGYDEFDRAAQVEQECVLVYLMKPIGEIELRAAIRLVLRRFEQFKILHREEPDLRKALANRQRVERAKELLMRRQLVDDETAFNRIVQMARERSVRIAEAAAEMIGSSLAS